MLWLKTFECQRIKFRWQNGSKFSHLLRLSVLVSKGQFIFSTRSVSQSKEVDYEKNTVGSLPISNNQICNIQVWLTIPRIDLSDTDPFLTNLSPLWCPKPPSPNARNVHCNGWDFLFVPPVASADDQNFATLTKKHYISSLSQHVTRARRSKHVVQKNSINHWVKRLSLSKERSGKINNQGWLYLQNGLQLQCSNRQSWKFGWQQAFCR